MTKFNFSFNLGGKPFTECDFSLKTAQNGNVTTNTLTFKCGLVVKNVVTRYPDFDATETVNYFENTADKDTPLIEKLYDSNVTFPVAKTEEKYPSSYLPDTEKATKIYAPIGSDLSGYEFFADPDFLVNQGYPNHLEMNKTVSYATCGGRSSDARAPFFNLHSRGTGFIYAVGWTGQWNCTFTRSKTGVNVKSGIEDCAFVIKPNESFRTSSAVYMNYNCDVPHAQNKWRKFIKTHFSVIGAGKRQETAPLSCSLWGGMSTKGMLDRLEAIKANGFDFSHIWIDAGWYGTSDKPSPNEFAGDWWDYTGDWRVNPHIHPDGLTDVVKSIKGQNKKFILWLEPERIRNAPIIKEHPEYLIKQDEYVTLLNLGNPQALNYCIETCCKIIDTLKVDVYRQDFNCQPLAGFRMCDAENRKGITEIKYINGLYKFWDALLERYPHLIIDNCASGGRRIDIETLKRSIPLWRSDAQCPANPPSHLTQQHAATFGSWLPYSGTSLGRSYDLYNARSAYAPALGCNFVFSETEEYFKNAKQIEFISKVLKEYKSVRQYLSADIFPLTKPSAQKDVFAVIQYNDAEKGEGLITAFRREECPYPEIEIGLCDIESNATYLLTDIDTNEEKEYSGSALLDGIKLEIDKKRSSKLIIYKKI